MQKKYLHNLYYALIDQWKNKGLFPEDVKLSKKIFLKIKY